MFFSITIDSTILSLLLSIGLLQLWAKRIVISYCFFINSIDILCSKFLFLIVDDDDDDDDDDVDDVDGEVIRGK